MATKRNINEYELYNYIVETNCTHEECAAYFNVSLKLLNDRLNRLPDDYLKVLKDITTANRMRAAATAYGVYASSLIDPYDIAEKCYEYIMETKCNRKECAAHFGLPIGRLKTIRLYLSDEQLMALEAHFDSLVGRQVKNKAVTANDIYRYIVENHCSYADCGKQFGLSVRTIARRVKDLTISQQEELHRIATCNAIKTRASNK